MISIFLKCVFSEQHHCGEWPCLGERKQSPCGGSRCLQQGLLAVRSIMRCGVGRAGCMGSGCRVNSPCFSAGQSVVVPEKCLKANLKGTQIWCSWDRAEPSLQSLGTSLDPGSSSPSFCPWISSEPSHLSMPVALPWGSFPEGFLFPSKLSISPKKEAFGQRNNHGIVKGGRPLR